MRLKLQRSQRSGLTGKVVFALNARIELSPAEGDLVRKYGLGKQTVYDSEARRKHADTLADASQGRVGLLRGFAAMTMAALALHVTIDSLVKGQHIEAKSLDELLGAEAAVREACEKVKLYLEIAATFDGREEVVEV